MKIRVTKRDIAKGKRGHATQCPIAFAIHRHFPKSVTVKVNACHATVLRLRQDSEWFDLPQQVINWIFAFDQSGPAKVKPFTFILK